MEIFVRHPKGEPAVVRMPSYDSVEEAAEDLEIAQKRERIAELNEKAMGHMLRATVAAGELVITSSRTTAGLVEAEDELAEAVSVAELNKELRPTRRHTERAIAEKAMHEAVAASTIAKGHADAAPHAAAAIVVEAQKKYADVAPADPKDAAKKQSRAEKEAATKEWAMNVVTDVANWAYPATDAEGYYAYAACSYYGPRLDEGKSHEEALDVALEQLLRRKKLRGPFPAEEVEKLAYRALGVWKKWKTLKLEERVDGEKQKTADTTRMALETAREQRVAAEIVYRTVNGREGDEDFDTTK
jgi:hypothetical protein